MIKIKDCETGEVTRWDTVPARRVGDEGCEMYVLQCFRDTDEYPIPGFCLAHLCDATLLGGDPGVIAVDIYLLDDEDTPIIRGELI